MKNLRFEALIDAQELMGYAFADGAIDESTQGRHEETSDELQTGHQITPKSPSDAS